MAEGEFVFTRGVVIIGRKVRPRTETNGRNFPVKNSADFIGGRHISPRSPNDGDWRIQRSVTAWPEHLRLLSFHRRLFYFRCVCGFAACILPQAIVPTENTEHAEKTASVFSVCSVGTTPPFLGCSRAVLRSAPSPQFHPCFFGFHGRWECGLPRPREHDLLVGA